MDLSVIIVNYRGWKKLRECLDALASIHPSDFSFEVIVADNNSGDGNIGQFIADYPAFRFVINERNGGFAYGCNEGARHSTGNVLLFLNPDTVAGSDAIATLYKRSAVNKNSIISCAQFDERGKYHRAYGQFLAPGKLTGAGRAISSLFSSHKPDTNPLRPDWVSGSVIMTGRDLFTAIGGFDEDFWMYYEDMDLCYRARKAGADVLYFTDCSIEHKHGGSSRINISTTALTKCEVLISRHLFVSKHFKPAEALISQVILVAGNVLSGIIEAFAGILFFFIPRVYVRLHIFLRLLRYYSQAVSRQGWISKRSVNA